MTEKAISRLAELMPTYKERLQNKEVYSNFVGLVNRAKQFASQEMAQAVDEWKTQLEKVKANKMLEKRCTSLFCRGIQGALITRYNSSTIMGGIFRRRKGA